MPTPEVLSPARGWAAALGGGVAFAATVAGCGFDTHTADARPDPAEQSEASAVSELAAYDLALEFDDVAVPGDVVPGAENRGTATVDIEIVTAGGGNLIWVPGSEGGRAVRTPPYTPDGEVAAAALLVLADGDAGDPLSPGRADFTIGVDIWADPPDPGRPEDDGGNLVQRGRFGETAQFKIQLDHGVPSCRIAGTKGEVMVSAAHPVASDHWYRITCGRAGGRVEMAVLDLADPAAEPEKWIEVVDPGLVRFGSTTPLSIAAKVGAYGAIDPTSVDQFNGVIDRVYVDVRE